MFRPFFYLALSVPRDAGSEPRVFIERHRHDRTSFRGFRRSRRRRRRQPRLEIRGYPFERLDWLKSLGCFTEIISYRTRLFVPPDQAEAILSSIVGAAA